jgi:hypothetical protein
LVAHTTHISSCSFHSQYPQREESAPRLLEAARSLIKATVLVSLPHAADTPVPPFVSYRTEFVLRIGNYIAFVSLWFYLGFSQNIKLFISFSFYLSFQTFPTGSSPEEIQDDPIKLKLRGINKLCKK